MVQESAANRLITAWKLQKFRHLQNGIGTVDIATFEAENNLRVPPDLAEYLRKANGFKLSDELDMLEENGFEFLPLLKKNIVLGEYFVFCRWPFALLEYAICLAHSKNSGTVVLLGDDSDAYFLASDFSAFVELYLGNAAVLYKPESQRINLA